MRGVGRILLPGVLAGIVLLTVASSQAAPGVLDASFGTGGVVTTDIGSAGNEAFALLIQPNGKLVAGGYLTTGPSDEAFALARYNSNGSLDTSFGSGGTVSTEFGPSYDYVIAVLHQQDAKVVAVGSSYHATSSDFALARYASDGSLDASFGSGGKVSTPLGPGYDNPGGALLQPNGKIVVAGTTYGATDYDFALVRYLTDGSLDSSFGSGGAVMNTFGPGGSAAYTLVRQPDGKLVAAGRRYDTSGSDFALARYEATGSLDTTFGTGGKVITSIGPTYYDSVYALALQADGKIVAGGRSYESVKDTHFALVRYNPDGSLDSSFGSGGKVVTDFGPGYDQVYALLVQLNGKIVAAGYAQVGTPPKYVVALARYKANGSLDTSFGSGGMVTTAIGVESYVEPAVLQPDGKIVIAGGADNGANYDFALARYQGDTCVVPKLKGRKLAAAKSLIKRKQCKVGKVKKRFSKKVKKGRVISQSPAAGTKVAAATKVNLGVSKGPKRR